MWPSLHPVFDALGPAGQFGPVNIFIHMTGMSDQGWKYAADAGAHVSLSVPVEMHMRHGTPPTQKVLDMGMTLKPCVANSKQAVTVFLIRRALNRICFAKVMALAVMCRQSHICCGIPPI